jgi:putative flippase GtrA
VGEHLPQSLDRVALAATWHCLTGCAIGEILGLVIASALDWGNLASVAIAVVLAFFFGYSLTLRPLVRGGVPLPRAARVALAADTVSISVMEIVDNAIVLLVPGAMAAGLGEVVFWWSLVLGLALAFVAAFPVNRLLIARGGGHAVVHAHH